MTFEDIERLDHVEPTFFAKAAWDTVPLFLRNRNFNKFEIISKTEAINRFGPDLKIPDVRLTPNAPRIERSVLCLMAKLNPEQTAKWIEEMYQSQEAIALRLSKDVRIQKELHEMETQTAT